MTECRNLQRQKTKTTIPEERHKIAVPKDWNKAGRSEAPEQIGRPMEETVDREEETKDNIQPIQRAEITRTRKH